MSKQFDTLVFIGRFQPVTIAHQEIIRRAMAMTSELLIIVGSANQPSTYKNPWSYFERHSMLLNVLNDIDPDEDVCRVQVQPAEDNMYNDTAWAAQIQGIVSKYTILGGKTGIIGHNKDESSFYLSMFPQWTSIDVGLIEPLNASNVRDLYFRETVNLKFISSVVPPSVFRMLDGQIATPWFLNIIEERTFVEKYRQQYAGLPYPPIFTTADAVVICSGHVLLIKRRAAPGKGLWALPGGYMNANTDRSVVDTALRELREETKIAVPLPVLRGSIVDSRVFDAIDRSPRGRIITHAVKIVIQLVDGKLPKIKGSDDAEKAKWVPIGEVKRNEMFEDHFDIISWAISV